MTPTILLVDTDPNRRNNTALKLRMNGYAVEIATGGFHLCHLIEKYKFSCVAIFGDQHDMAALEIISLTRTVHGPKELPLILIDKGDDKQEILEAYSTGLNDYIPMTPTYYKVLIEKFSKYDSKPK